MGQVRLTVYEKDRDGEFPLGGVYYRIGGDGQGNTTVQYQAKTGLTERESKALAALRQANRWLGSNEWQRASEESSNKYWPKTRDSLVMDKELVVQNEDGKYGFPEWQQDGSAPREGGQ